MIDEALCANFHYDYCRRLGQLKAVRVFQLTGDPGREFLEESVQRGQRLGNIKTGRPESPGRLGQSL